jgi:NAD(P)H-flavin reductase
VRSYRFVLLTLPIREIVPATPRARIVRLDLDGQTFEYAPGQAVLIGNHGSDVRKPYSIAGAPEDARRDGVIELLVGVKEDGDATDHLALERGAAVDVEGPLGSFTFPHDPAERNFVFVAGGTGIAPLRAMLRHVILRSTAARHVGLLYSARTPEEFAFASEFHALAATGIIDFRQTITRDTDRQWSGARGRIGRRDLQQLVHDPETLCFVCGPRALVDEMPKLLEEIGVSRERIRIEEW